jgi:methylase of polypeptide subunit release factors
MSADAATTMHWTALGTEYQARWRSSRGLPPPRRVLVADDTMTADTAWHHACEGTALMWRGDYPNARQLLSAMGRRADKSEAHRAGKRKPGTKDGDKDGATAAEATGADLFNRYRMRQAQRSRTLGMLLIPFSDEFAIELTRAPDVRAACTEAWGAPTPGEKCVASLRELLGIVGAYEWQKKGIELAALGDRIHPRYGVFAPVRSEYVELVAKAPLPDALKTTPLAFDIGTGTGVLAAVLARREVPRIIATDNEPRALECARENIARLGLADQVSVVEADLFPAETDGPASKAALIVCNPPWIPARPGSPLERGIYDGEGRMLGAFLDGLAARLVPGGEGWLILSDIAEHLGLRTREALLARIESAGLAVVDRIDTRPVHPRAADATDPLHEARRREVTSLWRLACKNFH